MRVFLLLSLVASSSAAWWPSRPLLSPTNQRESQPLHNVHHLFNAIHSSMRQWGSSLNHNGVSYFLATVPEGVLLHHGSYRAQRVEGMEWLAFEPEHAMNFAWKRCDNETLHFTDSAANHARSPRGWMRALQHDADDYYNMHLQGVDQAVIDDKAKPPRRRPICIEPGYVHTYSTPRPLHLLYIDGQSAAKTTKGTLDTQDYILRYNGSTPKTPPPDHAFGDLERARDLCHLAKNDYEGKIDGFLRMEHGFEIVMCDFSVLDVVSVLQAQNEDSGNSFDPDDPFAGETLFAFMSAVAARYDGIGGDRVQINYDDFVTGFAYPEIDLWRQGGQLPRLNGTSLEMMKRLRGDVKSLVLRGSFPGAVPSQKSPPRKPHYARHGAEEDRLGIAPVLSSNEAKRECMGYARYSKQDKEQLKHDAPQKKALWKQKIERDISKHHPKTSPGHFHRPPLAHVNWQSIADQYVTRYAKRLPYLISGRFDTSKSLSDEIMRIYKPYMNRTQHVRQDEIERCTTAYMPSQHLAHPSEDANTQTPSLAQRAITAVANDICTTLWDVMDPKNATASTSTYEDKVSEIKSLIRRLAWTEWKKCTPGCGIDEVCYSAIWPYGSQRDHDQPSCKNGSAMMDRSSMGYWFDPEQGPGGKDVGEDGGEL